VFHGRLSPEARRRLEVLVETCDGFRIAEEDLAMRGPGDLLGTRQAGLPELRVADLVADGRWLARAREDARELAGHLEEPGLAPLLARLDPMSGRRGSAGAGG
jgi:ATP-dependent DNA helicase RecG